MTPYEQNQAAFNAICGALSAIPEREDVRDRPEIRASLVATARQIAGDRFAGGDLRAVFVTGSLDLLDLLPDSTVSFHRLAKNDWSALLSHGPEFCGQAMAKGLDMREGLSLVMDRAADDPAWEPALRKRARLPGLFPALMEGYKEKWAQSHPVLWAELFHSQVKVESGAAERILADAIEKHDVLRALPFILSDVALPEVGSAAPVGLGDHFLGEISTAHGRMSLRMAIPSVTDLLVDPDLGDQVRERARLRARETLGLE